MALIDDFVGGITVCMGDPELPVLGILEGPFGLTNILGGLFLSMFAGVNFVLDFIPPVITNPPSLPDIGIFTDAMLAGVNFPANHIEFEFIPGIIIPEVTDKLDLGAGFSIEAPFRLITAFIALPFAIISAIIEKLLELEIAIPSVELITEILFALFIDLGLALPPPAIPSLGILALLTCIPLALFGLITSLFP